MLCVTLTTDGAGCFGCGRQQGTLTLVPRALRRCFGCGLHATSVAVNARSARTAPCDLTENRLMAGTRPVDSQVGSTVGGTTGPPRSTAYGSRSPNPSPWRMGRHRKVRDDTEVVARPDAVDLLIEGSSAVEDVQGRPVHSAPNQDIINAAPQLERHLTGGHQRVDRRKSVPRICGMCRLPGIPIGNAQPLEGLPSGPEPY